MQDERYTVLVTRYEKSGSGEWYEDTVCQTVYFEMFNDALRYAFRFVEQYEHGYCLGRIDRQVYYKDSQTWEYVSRDSLRVELSSNRKAHVTYKGIGVQQ